MKKILAASLLLSLSVLTFSSCQRGQKGPEVSQEDIKEAQEVTSDAGGQEDTEAKAPKLSTKITDDSIMIDTPDTWVTVATLQTEEIIVEDDEHKALSESLLANNKEALEYMADFKAQTEDELLGDEAIENAENMQYAFGSEVELLRVDSKITSFIRDEYTYTGGAHPLTAISGYTYDSVTGEPLYLRDIVQDMDAFFQLYLKKLSENEIISDAWEGWEDTVIKSLKDDDGQIAYALSEEGLVLIINTYVVAPYAAGQIECVVPYGEIQ